VADSPDVAERRGFPEQSSKKHVSPHVLRHPTAMQLLNAGIDRAVIALWLGHESVETTQVYLHADLSIKERALALTTPVVGKPGRCPGLDLTIEPREDHAGYIASWLDVLKADSRAIFARRISSTG